jgi:hypothetical protein
MSILMAAVLALAANDEYDLELASALARRGWVELAEQVAGRIDKNQPGLPMVLAEVSFAKARREADVRRAAKELDVAVERLTRAGRAPTLDERGMTGWLHIQKAKILAQAAEDDATLQPEALKSWEATETYYRAFSADLEKMPSTRAVEEAKLDAQLEIPKAISAQARVPAVDAPRRAKLLQESIRLFSDFSFGIGAQPVLLEAILEEGRSRADLKDYGRAERCFKSLPKTALDVKKAGYPMGDYVKAQLHAGVVSLAEVLTPAGKPKEAVALCDAFLNENPRLQRSPIGSAILLAKADALKASGDENGAIDLAVQVSGQDDGAVGRKARAKVKDWTKGKAATPERVLAVAEGMMEKGEYREALVQLGRTDFGKLEPVAMFKRGECHRALKQDKEASAAWQELYRKHPAHPLAKPAAQEAVKALSSAGADEAALEKLLNEVEKLGFGDDMTNYLRAGILEGKKQYKAAAERYLKIEEASKVYDDALVSGGHCLRLDGQIAAAEATLKKVLSRPAAAPRLLFTARHELAMIALKDRPKEALDHLEKCAALLPAESPTHARILESEIQASLALKDAEGAAARLEKLLAKFPDEASTIRSCRRVAAQFEPADPKKAAKYYRTWLDRASTTSATPAETQSVADALYRIARAANGMGDNVVSVIDLNGKPVRDRAVWQDAVRAHDLVIQTGGPDAVAASARLVTCAGLAGDWAKAKAVAEKLVQEHQLLNKDGTINVAVLADKRWLAGVYFEYGHAFYQLGKSGQAFQYGNGLTAFNNLVRVTQNASEPWWRAQYLVATTLFERGAGTDIRDAGALLSSLERNNPDFDGGKYGMRDRFTVLRDQVRALQR